MPFTFRPRAGAAPSFWAALFAADAPRPLQATRALLALTLALGLVAVCFNLPIYGPEAPFDPDHRVDPFERLTTDELALLARQRAGADVPVTRLDAAEPIRPGQSRSEAPLPEEETPLPEPSAPEPPEVRLQHLGRVLEYSDQMPEIVGGVSAFYIRIAYPQAAIDQNIQGRLLLTFVVEPSGRASEIVVEESLHPLCDSAAVRALRQTRFMPGVQNGEPVRVRLRLPVRFEIRDLATRDA